MGIIGQFSIFIASLLSFCILMYLVCGLWFKGKKGTYLTLFFILGFIHSVWVLLNGINIMVSEEIYRMTYPLVMILVCILPYFTLRYVLYFTKSRLVKNKWIIWGFGISTIVDVILLLTNPWHQQFITGYSGIRPLVGNLGYAHMLLSYIPVIFLVVIVIIHIIKSFKNNPYIVLFGIGLLIPLVFNVMYSLEVFDMGVDITPYLFLIPFAIYTVFSIRFGLFDVKEVALSGLFTNLSDALLVVDNNGIIIEANKTFKESFSEIVIEENKTHLEYVVEMLESITVNRSLDYLFVLLNSLGEDIHNAEITIEKDGNRLTYTLSKDVLMKRGQYAGSIIKLVDVSSYRQMITEINEKNIKLTELKDMAESASNAKSAFLANMSHEIRTPMNAIIGMSEIARQSSGKPEKVSDCLVKINGAAKLLLGIINDVLDMSKIESNKYTLYEDRFIFNDMIQNIIAINSIRAEEKGLKLKISIDKDIPKEVIADELRLSQVINNLMSNAVKFTPDGGKIELSVNLIKRESDCIFLKFMVSDTGIGIDSEKQSVLFNAFEQADLSISRRFGGTGLGLAISQRIIGLMGGSIKLTSILGKGSKFYFDVCIKLPNIETVSLNESNNLINDNNRKTNDFSGYNILLVEDIDINREIVVALFEDTGVSIECAENGKKAVDLVVAQPEKYDIIYMDIQMPVLDGYSAAKQIRQLNNVFTKKIPIIAMTANAFAEDIKKAKDAGMDDHIAKPIDVNILFQKTNKYIKKQRALKQTKSIKR